MGTLQLKGDWLLLAMLIGLAAVSLSLNTAAADQPVNITCNEDFQAQGFPGSGTPSDPYVIEGLTITGADVAINIENTTVYVVIRNCNLTSNAYALYLYNVSNIRVEDCTFANNDNSTCILLFNSSFTSCTFSGNEYGCCISTSYNVSFSFCSFQDNQRVGCYLDYCFYFNFSDCDFRGSDLCGCLCYDSMLLDFRACLLSGGFWGSGCYDNCSYITIFNSTIYGSSLYFNHSFNITIWYNDFSNAAINMEYSGPFMLNSPYPVIYYYNGDWHRNYIGNDWPGYTGSDPDGDGIGNTPYTIDGYHDCFPLVDNRISYKIPKKSAPIIITCNEDFDSYGFPGEGTSTNPYVIDGLTIGEASVAISIANTDAYVDIKNCNLVYNDYGLYIDDASNIRVINCVIKSNTYEACLCLNSSNIQFFNCDVRDNGGTGFLCADCSNLGFSSCSITGNNCSCFLYKCSNTHFSTSSFSNNLHEGFVAINCTNLAFTTCHFDDNQELGLYCANCSHVDISYGFFIYNKDCGVICDECSDFSFSYSDFNISKNANCLLQRCSDFTFYDCLFFGNDNSDDCSCRFCTNLNFTSCEFITSPGSGCNLDTCFNAIIFNCYFKDNLYALTCSNCYNITISSSTFYGGHIGLRGINSTLITTSGARFNSYYLYGCYLKDCRYFSFSSCHFDQNIYPGFQGRWCSNIIFSSCSFDQNRNGGFNCTECYNMSFSHCSFTDSQYCPGFLSIDSQGFTFQHCTFKDNGGDSGFVCRRCKDYSFTHCFFSGNSYGADCKTCSGFTFFTCTFTDSDTNGISCDYSSNLQFINCSFSKGYDSCAIFGSTSILLLNCSCADSGGAGLYLFNCSDAYIANGFFRGNQFQDISLQQCFNTSIVNCLFSSSYYGCSLLQSSYINCLNCSFTDSGLTLWSGCHHLQVEGCTVNDKPILYLEGKAHESLNGVEAGQLIINNCSYITVENMELANASMPLELFNSSHIHIANVKVQGGQYGFYCYKNFNLTILNCSFIDSRYGCFSCMECTATLISNSSFQGGFTSFSCEDSSNITIHRCRFTNSQYCGYELFSCSNLLFSRCSSSNSRSAGECYECHNITFSHCSFTNCSTNLGSHNYCSNFTFHHCLFNSSSNGILCSVCTYYEFHRCTFSNCPYGSLCGSCSHFTFQSCLFKDNQYHGLQASNSHHLLFHNCTFTNNDNGIYCPTSCPYFKFIGCLFTDNEDGVDYRGDHAIFFNCTFQNSYLRLRSSHDISIWYNDFLGTDLLWEEYSYSINLTSPTPVTYIYRGNSYTKQIGNYWSDYVGSDSDGDGIGDYSYTSHHAVGFTDYSPLIEPKANYRVLGHLENCTLHLHPGWNLISIPGRAYKWYNITEAMTAYLWNPATKNYQPLQFTELPAGKGFWIYTPIQANITVLYNPSAKLELTLDKGWNLIGAPNLHAKIIVKTGKLVKPFFTYDPTKKTYIPVNTLQPGKACWIYAIKRTEIAAKPI